MMKRRSFLQLMAATGLTSTVPSFMLSANQVQAAEIEPYSGDFYVLIDAEGGWDVTSFCDPKQNSSINK